MLQCFYVGQDVVEKCQLSGEFFTAYLHQNYPDFFSELEDVVAASNHISDADNLTRDWQVTLFQCNIVQSIVFESPLANQHQTSQMGDCITTYLISSIISLAL